MIRYDESNFFHHAAKLYREYRAGKNHPLYKNFKPSDTPETDPTTSPDTPPQGTRPNNKEIA